MVGTLRFAPTLRSPSPQPHPLQQHGFAGVDQFFQRDTRKTLASGGAAAREWWDVNEGGEARAVAGIDGLDRAPAQIVAEIASGIARGAGIEAGTLSGTQQLGGMRAESLCVRPISDRSLSGAGLRSVRPQHGDGIAGAGLDPDVSGATGEAEHQQRVW